MFENLAKLLIDMIIDYTTHVHHSSLCTLCAAFAPQLIQLAVMSSVVKLLLRTSDYTRIAKGMKITITI